MLLLPILRLTLFIAIRPLLALYAFELRTWGLAVRADLEADVALDQVFAVRRCSTTSAGTHQAGVLVPNLKYLNNNLSFVLPFHYKRIPAFVCSSVRYTIIEWADCGRVTLIASENVFK